MAVEHATSIETLARTLAEAVQHYPWVRGLWLYRRPDRFVLSLLTERIDSATEDPLFRIYADLIAQFPEVRFEIDILNPHFYQEGTDLMRYVPNDAQPIPLIAH